MEVMWMMVINLLSDVIIVAVMIWAGIWAAWMTVIDLLSDVIIVAVMIWVGIWAAKKSKELVLAEPLKSLICWSISFALLAFAILTVVSNALSFAGVDRVIVLIPGVLCIIAGYAATAKISDNWHPIKNMKRSRQLLA
jgi:peptidoglycan/LPS O-acetylase OafA/YrhL